MIWLLLLVLMVLPARADDKSEIAALFPQYTVSNLKVVEDWATVHIVYNSEGEGTGILRRIDGKWTALLSGGGAMGPTELYQAGAPVRLWKTLIPGFPEADYVKAAEPHRCWPETSTRQLTEDDLNYRSAWELTMMRNEVFARKGRPFKDAYLREYFISRGWYQPDPRYTDARLSALERKNVDLISAYQKKSGKQF